MGYGSVPVLPGPLELVPAFWVLAAAAAAGSATGGFGSLPLRPPPPVLLPCGLGASVAVAFLLLAPSAAARPRRALTGEEEEEPLLAEVPLLGGLPPPEGVLPLLGCPRWKRGMKRRPLGEGDARLSCSRLLLVESHQRCHGCLGLDAKNISALP
jgi:hypothetical protein